MIALILFALASILDGISTWWFLKKYPGVIETNPILGKHPSTLRLAVTGLIYWAIVFTLWFFWHAESYGILMAAGYHVKCAQDNFRIQL